MSHRVLTVEPKNGVVLAVTFRNGVIKNYDVRQLYPVFPQFRKLQSHPELFLGVKVDAGGYGISWDDELDLEAEELWENGRDTGMVARLSVYMRLGEKLQEARSSKGMTQKQLSAKTGINQGDISKIENGTANPSVMTLMRLAEGMDLELDIQFSWYKSYTDCTVKMTD